MLRYFLKRILWLIPTLWIISVVVFFLAKATKGDAISPPRFEENMSLKQEAEYYKSERIRMRLDLPLFYFNIHRASQTDTVYRIPERHREALLSLAYHCNNWPKVDRFYAALKKAAFQKKISKAAFNNLISSYHQSSLKANKSKWTKEIDSVPVLKKRIIELQSKHLSLDNYLLNFKFYGFDNQYQQWLIRVLNGNGAYSSLQQKEQGKQLLRALQWTLGMSLLSLFLAFGLALLLGLLAFKPAFKQFKPYLERIFLSLYATPNFLMATILIFFFASGHVLKWLPLYGIGDASETDGTFSLIQLRAPYLILPLICYTYAALAYFFEQVKGNLANQLKSDYLLTAQAKGLSYFASLSKHALPNAIISLISLLGSSIPALISGSFIIETIFNLPGMGKLSVEAFLNRDYDLIFTITLIGAALTLLGNLISDFAYHAADPRISIYQKEKAK